MSDWTDCDAFVLIGEPLDVDIPEDSPQWLIDMCVAAHDLAHDAVQLRWPEIVVTCRLWLPGDENRLLPMPLRYAAAQPSSAGAILGVLTRGTA
jgi:hypothetical protein